MLRQEAIRLRGERTPHIDHFSLVRKPEDAIATRLHPFPKVCHIKGKQRQRTGLPSRAAHNEVRKFIAFEFGSEHIGRPGNHPFEAFFSKGTYIQPVHVIEQRPISLMVTVIIGPNACDHGETPIS